MHRTMKEFLTENVDYMEMQDTLKADIVHLRIDDSYVQHKAKEKMHSLLMRDEEMYRNIIEIIKIQNELDDHLGKTPRAKFTNLEYLLRKQGHEVATVLNKWVKMKKAILKDG